MYTSMLLPFVEQNKQHKNHTLEQIFATSVICLLVVVSNVDAKFSADD